MIPDCWSIEYEELGVADYEELMLKDNIELFELITNYLTEEIGEWQYRCVGFEAEYNEDMIYIEEMDWEEIEDNEIEDNE